MSLPPVGDAVTLRRGAAGAPPFAPFWQRLYASGTAALAAAIQAALALHRGREEVILPAYGCPALVAATLHAGGRPVLVDLAPGTPWLDLGRVAAALTPRTAAIVAVDLLGIPERIGELRRLAAPAGVLLIEDSAQALLEGPPGAARGDAVVLSFGRGKPVSLLGGGAVLWHDPAVGQRLPAGVPADRPLAGRRLQAALYNRLRRPWAYGIVRRLPLLHLGETRFEPLAEIGAAPPWLADLLPAALAAWRRRQDGPARLVRRLLAAAGAPVIDLAVACDRPPGGLLRYPLLLPPPLRGACHRALDRAGLGSSLLYGAALPEIPGVAQRVEVRGGHGEASDFARRLLTLPVHDGVRPHHLARMEAVLGTLTAAWRAGELKEVRQASGGRLGGEVESERCG